MKIEGTGNLAQELRQLAGDVEVRRKLEESEIDQKRLQNLGELLLIAADMAADIGGPGVSAAHQNPEIVEGMFEEILYREFPDGPPAEN